LIAAISRNKIISALGRTTKRRPAAMQRLIKARKTLVELEQGIQLKDSS
jgi:hypothetical protein